MVLQTIGFALARRIGSVLLGGIILWHVAEHCGAPTGRAIVHVSQSQVDVTIDDARYRVEAVWETPIVCDLRPGRHTLRMLQGGRVVSEEQFSIAAGEEIVLTAWEGDPDGRSPKPAD